MQELFAYHLFPAFRVGHAVNLGNLIFPLLKKLLRDLIHPPEKRVRARLLSRCELEKGCAQEREGNSFHKKLPVIVGSCIMGHLIKPKITPRRPVLS
jgi:hypothetical protein